MSTGRKRQVQTADLSVSWKERRSNKIREATKVTLTCDEECHVMWVRHNGYTYPAFNTQVSGNKRKRVMWEADDPPWIKISPKDHLKMKSPLRKHDVERIKKFLDSNSAVRIKEFLDKH